MKLEELLPLCKFYRAQREYPTNEQEELAFMLSTIEGNVVDMLTDRELMPGEDLRQVFDDYVAAMIGKWHPFECNELWELYTSK